MPKTPCEIILHPAFVAKAPPIPNAERIARNDARKWAARGGAKVGNISRQLLRQMQRRSGT